MISARKKAADLLGDRTVCALEARGMKITWADSRPQKRMRRLEAAAKAARLFRKADTGGGFNDVVVCGKALDKALSALDEEGDADG